MKDRFILSADQLTRAMNNLRFLIISRKNPCNILKGIYFTTIDGKISLAATDLTMTGMVRLTKNIPFSSYTHDAGYIENPFLIDFYDLDNIRKEIIRQNNNIKKRNIYIEFEHRTDLNEVHIKCKDKNYVLYTFDLNQYPDISFVLKKDYVNMDCITLFSNEKYAIKKLIPFADKKHPKLFPQNLHIKTIYKNGDKYLRMETTDNFCIVYSDIKFYYPKQGDSDINACIPIKYMEKIVKKTNEIDMYYDNEKVVFHTYYTGDSKCELIYQLNLNKDVYYPNSDTIITNNMQNQTDVKFNIYRDSFMRLDIPFKNGNREYIYFKFDKRGKCLISYNPNNNLRDDEHVIDMAVIDNAVSITEDELYFKMNYRTFTKIRLFLKEVCGNLCFQIGINHGNINNDNNIIDGILSIKDTYIAGISILVSISGIEQDILHDFKNILKEVA